MIKNKHIVTLLTCYKAGSLNLSKKKFQPIINSSSRSFQKRTNIYIAFVSQSHTNTGLLYRLKFQLFGLAFEMIVEDMRCE
mgnify:CR=1 FL=1